MTARLYAILCRLCLQLAVAATAYALAAAAVRAPFLVLLLLIGAALHARRRRLQATSGAFGTARWASALDALRGGLFSGQGLVLGRFLGDPCGRLQAIALLFTLPHGDSALAVRLFLAAVTRRFS